MSRLSTLSLAVMALTVAMPAAIAEEIGVIGPDTSKVDTSRIDTRITKGYINTERGVLDQAIWVKKLADCAANIGFYEKTTDTCMSASFTIDIDPIDYMPEPTGSGCEGFCL